MLANDSCICAFINCMFFQQIWDLYPWSSTGTVAGIPTPPTIPPTTTMHSATTTAASMTAIDSVINLEVLKPVKVANTVATNPDSILPLVKNLDIKIEAFSAVLTSIAQQLSALYSEVKSPGHCCTSSSAPLPQEPARPTVSSSPTPLSRAAATQTDILGCPLDTLPTGVAGTSPLQS